MYVNEYKQTRNKKEFVALLLKKYPHLKARSADRRYYELKKFFHHDTAPPVSSVVVPRSLRPVYKQLYDSDDKTPVDKIKFLVINDMKKYNIRFTRRTLKTYGFTTNEINWLIDEEYITLHGE